MTRPGHQTSPRPVDVLIIGAGQAGLATAYWLTRTSELTVLVVDAHEVGRLWLERWNSLTLFTPRRFSGLPGLPFPRGVGCPSRLEMARYLQRYAELFELPVETGLRVQRLSRAGDRFLAKTAHGDVVARQVVLATGLFHEPRVPPASGALDTSVHQLHSSAYHEPADLPEGEVAVVGGGNSAAQLALELADTHQVTVVAPGQPWYLPEKVLGLSTYWWLYLAGILNASATSPVARYVRRRGDAIVGTQLRRQVHQGSVRLVPHRVIGARGRQLALADGTSLSVRSVLWCTGFRPDTTWIDIVAATDSEGNPLHLRGASPVAGLHWMGCPGRRG